MPDWWTYRLEDFLLFSPRVYWRMLELHNAELWPLHLLTLAAGLAIVFVMRRPREHGRLIALTLAAMWLVTGWFFLWERYAAINWAMAYVAPAFGVEAAFLAGLALRGGLVFDRGKTPAHAGLLMTVLGVAAYPLLPPVFGRPWAEAELFGIAPDPTAMATLGVILAARGRIALLSIPIPLAWLLASGLTLITMDDAQGWIPLLAAAIAVAVLALRLAEVRLGRGPPAIPG